MVSKRELKKIICLLLCLMMVFPAALSAQPGTDYEGHWAKDSIKVLFEKGFVTGYTDGSFKPDNEISRAEFIAIVNRAFDFNEKSEISFKDVNEGEWYYEHIARAVKAGYIKGFTDGTIRPGQNITKQEAAVIIARILDIEKDADTKIIASVKDRDKIPEWSIKGIAAVISKGYINKNKDGSFEPAKPFTRAEMAFAVEKSYVKAIKKLYAEPGVFTAGNIDGSVKIDNKDITLKDTVIEGDLILGEGIGEGNAHLINVTVKGDTVVKGGGINSIVIENCQFSRIIIIKEGDRVRVLAVGNTSIDETDVQSGAILESENLTGEGFGYVTIAKGLDEDDLIELIGNFESVEIRAEGVQIQTLGGTIGNLQVAQGATNVNIKLASDSNVTNLTINAPTTVTGKGNIQTAQINTDGTKIEAPVAKVQTAPGVEVDTGTRPTKGGGGSSRGRDDDTPSTIPVKGITVNPTELTLMAGGAVGRIATTISPPNATIKTVNWATSNDKVATVKNGVVTPIAAGRAAITVTTRDGNKTAACEVTVVSAVYKEGLISAIAYAQEKADNAVVGQEVGNYAQSAVDELTDAITAAQKAADNAQTTQEEADEAIATLNQAVATFEAAVIRPSDTYIVTVIGKPANGGSVTVTDAVYFEKGDKVTVKAIPNAGYGFIKWTDSIGNEISRDNPYTFYMPEKNVSLAANFQTGVIPVSDISVTPTTMNLKAGGATGTITATVEPANATNKNVTWTSSDISIATVENGVVTPKAEGTATITAKTNDGGKTTECTVMVGPAVTIAQQFPDTKLANRIAILLGISEDNVITKDIIEENISETNDELYLYGISDMTGFDIFNGTNLKTLTIEFSDLTNLDVSGLTNLTVLDVSYNNNLSSLDVNGLTNLEELYLYWDNLTSLDVSGLNNLAVLSVCDNSLTSIDVSNLTNLEELYLYGDNLTSNGVGNLTNLVALGASYKNFTSLDISIFTNLEELYVYDNNLSSLDVSKLTKLFVLDVSYNDLSSLNVSGLINLEELYASNNKLTSLDVSGLTNLLVLDVSNNNLSSLDVSGLTNLEELYAKPLEAENIIGLDDASLTDSDLDDTSLSSLTVNGESIDVSAQYWCYTIEIPFSEKGIPVVAATATDSNATVEVTLPAGVPGYGEIKVTGRYGSVRYYTLIFVYISANNSTMTIEPSDNVPVNTDAIVTITLKDKGSNPITGLYGFSISYTNSSTFYCEHVKETSTPGVYTFEVRNSAAENITIGTTVGNVSLNDVTLKTIIP